MSHTRSGIWISFLCCFAILAWRATSQPPVLLAQKIAPNNSTSPNELATNGTLKDQMHGIQKEVRALSSRVDLLIQALRDHQADEEDHLKLSPPNFRETWSLSLREVISISIQNSKVIRNLGGVTPFGVRGESETMLARINEDVSLETFNASLRNLISDLEATYWDLWLGHQEVETSRSLRDAAQVTWKRVFNASNADAQDEAQAREQYFFGRAQLETAQRRLFDSENRLRFLMGLAASDGRLIRPSDEPDPTKLELGPPDSYQQDSEPEVLQQRRNIDALKERIEQIPESSVAQRRHERLNLAREVARLEDLKLNLLHLLATAIRQVDLTYRTTLTHFNRWIAASEEVESLKALYEGGQTELDLVLDAQRRRAQSANDYRTALADFEKAKSALRHRTGTVLDHHKLQVVGDIAISEEEGSPQ